MRSFFLEKIVKNIRCQNRVMGRKNGICGRILMIATDAMIDILRIDPESGPVLRCPECPPEQRWSKLVNNNGKVGFESVDPPDEMPAEQKFDDLTIFEQVG